MKLLDFLMNRTQALELCAIRVDGWVKFTCWIDHEDLWEIPTAYANRTVKNDAWDKLTIATSNKTANGMTRTMSVPCHYIDI